jgi:heme/copper-type cytochrome/quinol oxidase subunit 2
MKGMSPVDLPANIQATMALVLVVWIGILLGFAWYLRRRYGRGRRSIERRGSRGRQPDKSRRRK